MPEKINAGLWMSRRALLSMSAGGAVVLLGRLVPARAQTILHGKTVEALPPSHLSPFYLSISADNRVRFTCPATEIGQGVTTSLTQIIAEELGADWATIDVELAGAGAAYVNPGKKQQSVGQSYSVRGYHDSLRLIGAAAREMLVAAAAAHWNVAPSDCTTRDSHVHLAGTSKVLAYAQIAEAASHLAPPEAPKLKDKSDFRLIGQSKKRLDTPDKVAGKTVYAIDIERPNMLCAALALAPISGGELQKFDRAAAINLPGVRQIVETTQGYRPGIAVLAERWWQAKAGLDACSPVFSENSIDTESLRASILAGLDVEPIEATRKGDPAVESAETLTAVYETPFLAHATMEPLSVVADVRTDGCTVWAGTQSQQRAQDDVAKFLGIPAEQVIIKTLPGGGGFGRRWYTDFILVAVELSKAAGRPVKLLFHREMDMTHDVYRPAFCMRGRAGVSNGKLDMLDFHVAGPSISEYGRPGRLNGRVDPVAVSGLKDCPYAVPFRVAWSSTPTPVPVGVWRSVGHSHNGFFLESLVDEAASAAGTDPIAFRLAALQDQPRLGEVLERVRRESGWGRKLPAGRGMGVAIAEVYGSYVAEVVEVEIDKTARTIRVIAIWAAIDCGTPINPKGVEAQVESSIVYGLSAALWGRVDFAQGSAVQTNFHDYRVLALREMPPVHTFIMDSSGTLGGAGEPGLVPIAAALSNAIVAAGGERPRRMPLQAEGWEIAA